MEETEFQICEVNTFQAIIAYGVICITSYLKISCLLFFIPIEYDKLILELKTFETEFKIC